MNTRGKRARIEKEFEDLVFSHHKAGVPLPLGLFQHVAHSSIEQATQDYKLVLIELHSSVQYWPDKDLFKENPHVGKNVELCQQKNGTWRWTTIYRNRKNDCCVS